MAESDVQPEKKRWSWVWISVILICLLMLGTAVYYQQKSHHSERERDHAIDQLADAAKVSNHQRVCINRWSNDFTTYYTGRLVVSAAVRDATTVRDAATLEWQHAVGQIFAVFTVALSPDKPPPGVLEHQAEHALNTFARAERDLGQAQADLAAANAAAGVPDPPPVLDLKCVVKTP